MDFKNDSEDDIDTPTMDDAWISGYSWLAC